MSALWHVRSSRRGVNITRTCVKYSSSAGAVVVNPFLYKKIGPTLYVYTFCIYKKSDRFIVYTKNRTLSTKNSVRLFVWSKIRTDFLYKQKIRPIICLYKNSVRFFIYTKSWTEFLWIKSDVLYKQKSVWFFVYTKNQTNFLLII